MAVPKRRRSKAAVRSRQTHKKAAVTALQKCPKCGAVKRPHRVCGECGYYAGRQAVEAREA